MTSTLSTLKTWQNRAIIECIEESNCDRLTLIGRITAEAKIDAVTAESYLDSYNANPNEGAIGVIVKAVHKEQLDEIVAEGKKAAAANKKTSALPPHPTMTTGTVETQPPPKQTPPVKQEAIVRQIISPIDDRPKKDPVTGEGVVAQILKLHLAGKSNKEIIEAGYNQSTVYRQVNEHKKRKLGLK